MHQEANRNERPIPGAPAAPRPDTHLIPQRQSPHVDSSTSTRDVKLRVLTEKTRELALEQSKKERTDSFRVAQLNTLNEYLKAALILGLSGSNIAFFGFSFSANPLMTTFSTFGVLVGGLSAVYGTLTLKQAWKNHKKSFNADSICRDPKIEKAQLIKAPTSITNSELEKAGSLYLDCLGNMPGANIAAEALVGLYDTLGRMGCCFKSALLLSRVGQETPSKYEGLPVQKELLAFALDRMRAFYDLLPDNEARLELTESVTKLALAAASTDRALALNTAERLHELARELPQGYELVRAHLLEAAYDLTKPADLIRENIEAQLQEISDQYLHSPRLLGRSRRELSKILNRTGTET